MINKVFLTGNLTRNPELRYTSGGTAVLGMGIAVNERVKDGQTGEWADRANFFDCTMFGKRAEGVARYLAKGSKVSLEGRLRWSQWERDGQKHSKVEVLVDEIEFMSKASDAPTQQPQQPMQQGGYVVQQPQQPYQQGGLYEEDLPF